MGGGHHAERADRAMPSAAKKQSKTTLDLSAQAGIKVKKSGKKAKAVGGKAAGEAVQRKKSAAKKDATKLARRNGVLPELPLYRIDGSPIEGYGVFAVQKIKKGTKILEYIGERIDEDEADDLGRVERVLLFDVGDGIFINGDPTAPAAFVNHSCDPNCHAEVIRKRVWIVADRTIQPGEELTYDYMFAPDQEEYVCHCGSPKCRGTINLRG